MAKTKQEIRNFLEGKVGQKIICPNGRQYDGQCVTLIKALLEFIGAPDPWKARGDAKYVGDYYLKDGIAAQGDGWLQVFIATNMSQWGHVWLDLKNEHSYESNGAKALICTKDTRPWNQANQMVNLDQWVSDINPPAPTGYEGDSIILELNERGIDSSYDHRAKLAEWNGITGYVGSPEQNTDMLNRLRAGMLSLQAPTSAPEPVAPQPVPEPIPEPETPVAPPQEPTVTEEDNKTNPQEEEEKEEPKMEEHTAPKMTDEEREQLFGKVEEATRKIADIGESEIAQEISAKAPYWLKVVLYVLVDLLLTASAIIPQVLIMLNSDELSVKGMMMTTIPATLAGAIQLSFKFLRKVSK